MIAHTIDAARSSRLSRVIVSTESPEIAHLATREGAEVPFLRPAEFATNTAPAISVVQHALDWLAETEKWIPDAVFYLQPTSPFRRKSHIDEAIDLMRASSADTVLSVARPSDHPAYMFVPEADGHLRSLLDGSLRKERRQDLFPVVSANCAVILSRVDFLLGPRNAKASVLNLDNFVPYFIDHPTTLDINTEQDFLFAEFLMQRRGTV